MAPRRVLAVAAVVLGISVAFLAGLATGVGRRATAATTAEARSQSLLLSDTVVRGGEVEPTRAARRPTYVEMRNVDYYLDTNIVLRIKRLRGTMRSRTASPTLVEDQRSR